MDVVCDTNIFMTEGYRLGTQRMRILLDYLKKTESRLIVHAIVEKEVEQHLRKDCREKIIQFQKALKSIQNSYVTIQGIQPIDVDAAVEQAVIAWRVAFEKLFTSDLATRLPLDETALEEAVRRAIERIAPCANKEEMRDTLIWLNFVGYCKKRPGVKEIAFISQNTKEFAGATPASLHPTLVDDITPLGVVVRYFPSLDHFVKEHATVIAHITKEWLEQRIDPDAFNEFLEGREELRNAYYYHVVNPGDHHTYVPVKDADDYTIAQRDLSSFTIWALNDQQIEVSLTFALKIEAYIESIQEEWRDLAPDIGIDESLCYPIVQEGECEANLIVQLAARIDGEHITLLDIEDVTSEN